MSASALPSVRDFKRFRATIDWLEAIIGSTRTLWNLFKVNNKDTDGVAIVYLLLILHN